MHHFAPYTYNERNSRLRSHKSSETNVLTWISVIFAIYTLVYQPLRPTVFLNDCVVKRTFFFTNGHCRACNVMNKKEKNVAHFCVVPPITTSGQYTNFNSTNQPTIFTTMFTFFISFTVTNLLLLSNPHFYHSRNLFNFLHFWRYLACII